VVFHYKRKKQYKKTRGHRQNYTELRVDAIELGSREPVAQVAQDEQEAKDAKETQETQDA